MRTSRRVARRGRRASVKASQATAKEARSVRPPLRWAASIGQMPPLLGVGVGADDDAVARRCPRSIARRVRSGSASTVVRRRWAGLRVLRRRMRGRMRADGRPAAGDCVRERDERRRRRALLGGGVRRRRPRVPGDRAGAGAGRSRARGGRRDLGALARRGRGRPGSASRRRRSTRRSPRPRPTRRRGRRRPTRPGRWCRCWRRCGRTSWSATSSRWRRRWPRRWRGCGGRR